MSAPFCLLNPPTASSVMSDFNDYVEKEAPYAFENGDVKEISRLINNFGVLKLVLVENFAVYARQTATGILFMSVVAWVIMLIALVFSIVLLISGIKQLLGRRPKQLGHQSMGFALVFGLVLIFPFFATALPLFMNFDVRAAEYAGLGGSAIAMLVLSAIALAGFACCKTVFEGEKLQPKRLITRGVSVACAIVIAACFTSGAVGITVVNPLNDKSVSADVNISEIQMGVELFPEHSQTSLETYYYILFYSDYPPTEKEAQVWLKQLFSPQVLVGLEKGSSYSIVGNVLEGLLLIVNLMAAAGISALSIVFLQEIASATRRKNGRKLLILNVVNCFLAVAVCAALAFTGTMAAQSFFITYTLAAGVMTAAVLAVGTLVQSIVLNKQADKAEKRENQIA